MVYQNLEGMGCCIWYYKLVAWLASMKIDYLKCGMEHMRKTNSLSHCKRMSILNLWKQKKKKVCCSTSAKSLVLEMSVIFQRGFVHTLFPGVHALMPVFSLSENFHILFACRSWDSGKRLPYSFHFYNVYLFANKCALAYERNSNWSKI